MTDRTDALDVIEAGGVIAVLRGISSETVGPIGDALAGGGVTAMEITADTPGAPEMITALANQMADRELLVGAGTVLDAPTARSVLLAGAQFIVTPTLDEGVIRMANRYGVPVIPGVMTPTEALRAMEAGADAVKLFPASSVGAGHVAAVAGPLPQVPIVPTGGISIDNVTEFIEAGAIAVGVGSSLVTDEIIEAEDWKRLETGGSEFVDSIAQARS